MPLLPEFWAGEFVTILVALFFLAVSAYSIRLTRRMHWKTVTVATLAYVACAGSSIGHIYLAQSLESTATMLRTRTTTAVLRENWGASFTKEKRTEYSTMIARQAYIDWGEIAPFIDTRGIRRSYAPTDDDETRRQNHVAVLDAFDHAQDVLEIFGIGWLAVPIIGIFFGISRWTQPFMRFLTTRLHMSRELITPPAQNQE